MFESSTNFLEFGRVHNLVWFSPKSLGSFLTRLVTQGRQLILHSVHKRMSYAFGRTFTFYI